MTARGQYVCTDLSLGQTSGTVDSHGSYVALIVVRREGHWVCTDLMLGWLRSDHKCSRYADIYIM